MTVTVVAGGKHSPGTTTLALTIATLGAAGLLVEADPSGGDLAARTGLALDPGLASLTVAARTGLTADHLHQHVQTLASDVDVLVGPVAVRHAANAIRSIGDPLAALLHQIHTGLAVVDVGRGDDSELVAPFLQVADRVLFVTGSEADDLAGARSRIALLADHTPAVITVVVTGRGRYRLGEISTALAAPTVVRLSWDPRAAARISTGLPFDRWTARSTYVRTVVRLLRLVSTTLDRDTARPAGETGGASNPIRTGTQPR